MASEIRVSTSVAVTKGALTVLKNASVTADMAGTHYNSVAQAIGTTEEALSINSDVALLGQAWLRNLDATNYIDVGIVVSAVFYPMLRLLPGEAQQFRWSPSVVPYAKAHTAVAVLEHVTLEA